VLDDTLELKNEREVTTKLSESKYFYLSKVSLTVDTGAYMYRVLKFVSE
jgi:hypothetical protein